MWMIGNGTLNPGHGGGAGAGNTVFLYPFDSDLSDSVVGGVTFVTGGVTIDTTVEKYGAGCANIPVDGTMTATSSWVMNTGTWTFETWFRVGTAGQVYIELAGDGITDFSYTTISLTDGSTTADVAAHSDDGLESVTWAGQIPLGTTISPDTWYHMAIVSDSQYRWGHSRPSLPMIQLGLGRSLWTIFVSLGLLVILVPLIQFLLRPSR
jgi:hypothetical protein